ncbi:MAG: Na+-dependent transporter [Methanomassiliicoccaceae archaeon]|nr:Na+-dependent transporter [Methanomassiliicoccaceae archaeon]
MALAGVVSDTRAWIVLGVACALIVGPVGEASSTLLVVVLIVQMTLSMDGLSFNRESLSENRRPILYSVAACFGVSTVAILLLGSLFMGGHPDIWKGWVMLAAVPCAVSVVTMSFFSRGNTTMCVLSLAVIYLAALAFTPFLTRALIGEDVSVARIFMYVVLFIAVPMAASVPLRRAGIGRATRIVAINAMLFLLVLLSLGQNRDYLFSEPGVVLLAAAACAVRIFAVSFAMLYILKRRGASRGNSMTYIPMAVWKNSGLGVTLCFVVFSGVPEAAMPCAISLLVELLWFAVFTRYVERGWPEGSAAQRPADG